MRIGLRDLGLVAAGAFAVACGATHRQYDIPQGGNGGGTDTGGAPGSGGSAAAGAGSSTGGTPGSGGSAAAGAGSSTGGAANTGGGGSCTDTTSDPHNCGACGHDCLGGACDLGACQPATIAQGQPHVSGLATDGTYVYWTGTVAFSGTDYYVSRRRVDGSDAIRVLAPAEIGAGGIALTASSIYWMAQGHLRVCPLPDCSGGPSDLIPTVGAARCGYSMLFASSKLYWSCGANYNADDGALWTLPIPLSTTTPVTLGPNPSNPATLASDSTNLYWINSSSYTNDNQNADGAVYRARLGDGTVTPLVTLLRGDIGAIAVAGSAVFIAGNIDTMTSAGTTGAVLRIPLPNGIGTAFPPTFAAARSVFSIVADGKYVYFSDTYSNDVSRCAVAGCNTTPEVIAPLTSSPLWMVQDAVSIYWATLGGAIQRLAK